MKHNEQYVIVIEDVVAKTIAATGAIFLERKFLRAGALAGHIEDIVVNKSYRGKDFGKMYR